MHNSPRDDSPILNAAIIFNERIGPYLTTIILGGSAAVMVIGALTAARIELSPEQRRVIVFCAVGLGLAGSITWLWILPRKDFLVIHEFGFRWRISLSKWRILPASGTVRFDELQEFVYCSSWERPQGLKISPNATTSEKLTGLIMHLSYNATSLEIANQAGSKQTIENLFLRFEHADLERFLSMVAEMKPQAVRVIS